MKCFEFDPLGTGKCRVTAWLHEDMREKHLPAIIICPGGAYADVSNHEAEPVANAYFHQAFQTFILRYSCLDNAKDFLPLIQLASTVSCLRTHVDEWCINPRQIAVCGFSAGGHLAASLGTLFNDEKFLRVYPNGLCVRPDAMILGYPVILANEFTHKESISCVSGNAPVGSPEFCYFGLDQHVDSETPPAFVWHTAADSLVPAQNSIQFAMALLNAGVPVEMHLFPDGYHGMSVCTKETGSFHPYNGRWVAWSVEWLKHVFPGNCV